MSEVYSRPYNAAGKTAVFSALIEDSYQGVAESRFFRGFTAPMMTNALERSKRAGQTIALAELRRHLQDLA